MARFLMTILGLASSGGSRLIPDKCCFAAEGDDDTGSGGGGAPAPTADDGEKVPATEGEEGEGIQPTPDNPEQLEVAQDGGAVEDNAAGGSTDVPADGGGEGPDNGAAPEGGGEGQGEA